MPIVNSRDVARVFEKRHDHVLRDIDEMATSSDLRALDWFRPVIYIDEKSETLRSLDLTRYGFALLVMGWTGEHARAFKVKYIQAFEAMEAAPKGQFTQLVTSAIEAIREIVAPLRRSLQRVRRRD